MKLGDLLTQKRPAILAKWLRLIVDTYPAETSRFLRREKDRFANPVGYAISSGIEILYDQVTHEMDAEKVSSSLDGIIRIKAVQDFSPSEAISFLFHLKRLVREELDAEIRENLISREELFAFESNIDSLALLSFDIFLKCREKIYELKANQARHSTFKLLERANLMSEIEDRETDITDENNEMKRGNGK
jgi:hypothetical protein